ncbi:MAG TPA: hypothetical protein DET40_02275 [Lentisphaeria bacterium]|nr:MAG: hypothetical protein A2X45_16875 [Lentisphaerae bacterium GWF2_50_93]HCE42358.1 hypothetical protein [Lentisphaeria bacterium]
MNYIIFTFTAVVLAVCQPAYCSDAGVTGDAPPIVHDFGKIGDTENPIHKFTVTNSTSGKFKVLQARVPCGCASTTLDRDSLEPGEECYST